MSSQILRPSDGGEFSAPRYRLMFYQGGRAAGNGINENYWHRVKVGWIKTKNSSQNHKGTVPEESLKM